MPAFALLILLPFAQDIHQQHLQAERIKTAAHSNPWQILTRIKQALTRGLSQSSEFLLDKQPWRRPLISNQLEHPHAKLWQKLRGLLKNQETRGLSKKEATHLRELQARSRYWAEVSSNPDPREHSTTQKHPAITIPQLVQFGGKEKPIGEYTITPQLLGKGQFGKVYRGRHTQNKTPVAIKLIDMSPEARKEAFQSRKLDHPNIVRLLDAFENDLKVILVMEYCNGGDLETAIQKELLHNELLVKKLFKQFLAGLYAIHTEKMLHRDLKPANLLLSDPNPEKAVLKIADLGFAKCKEEHEMCHSAIGTPLYMAPERLRQNEYNFQAEMWAAGIILYEMAFGKHPFGHAKSLIVLLSLARAGPQYPAGKVSPECIDLITRLLQPDPNQRLTIEQALAHPWFTTNSAPLPEPVQPRHPQAPPPEPLPQQDNDSFDLDGFVLVELPAPKSSGYDLCDMDE